GIIFDPFFQSDVLFGCPMPHCDGLVLCDDKDQNLESFANHALCNDANYAISSLGVVLQSLFEKKQFIYFFIHVAMHTTDYRSDLTSSIINAGEVALGRLVKWQKSEKLFGTCSTCQKQVCGRCWQHCANKETHPCDASARSSFKFCPQCFAPVWRAEGCASVFCLRCHSNFNYNTFAIMEKNAISFVANPDHAQWQDQEVFQVAGGSQCHYIFNNLGSHFRQDQFTIRDSLAQTTEEVALYFSRQFSSNFDKFLSQQIKWRLQLASGEMKGEEYAQRVVDEEFFLEWIR